MLWSMVVVAKHFLLVSSGLQHLRVQIADILLVLLQVHNDLKTKNILLSDNYATAKIGVCPVDMRSCSRLSHDKGRHVRHLTVQHESRPGVEQLRAFLPAHAGLRETNLPGPSIDKFCKFTQRHCAH